MSNQHVLKIHPAPLADLISGAKTAEVRRNDRDFQVGDTVHLMEVNPETGNWTGAADHVRTISHIQTGYGLPDGMCVLSYTPLFLPRNRLPGRLAIRAALPDVPGDMLDHGLFAALDAMAAPPAAAHGDEAVQYRLLRVGEIILATDEVMRDDCTTWVPMSEGKQLGIGWKWHEGLMPMRRIDAAMRAQGDGEVK